MEKVTVIQATPEQLQDAIIAAVRVELESLRMEFQPKQPTEYLTRTEVRDLLKVDLSTVHNWTKRGILKSYGIESRIFYKRSEVEAAIKPIN